MEKLYNYPELFKLIQEYTNLDKLYECNKYYKNTIKKYYIFCKKYSLKYYEDPIFYNFINQYIYTKKYLSIELSECTSITDVSALGNVHTLDLSYTNITDVSELGNVHKLNLSYTNITDVSALGNLHTLDLSYTNITDV